MSFGALALLGVVAIFFATFALKIAYIEGRTRRHRRGGFEVKLTSGGAPGMQRKDNDHG
jgi:hypothetical protein